MEEDLRRVELFYGKHAFLEFVFDDATSYIVRAYDTNDKNKTVVGCCYFNIEKLFQRQLRPEERLASAPYFHGLEKTPKTTEIYVTKRDMHKYRIDGDVLTFRTKGRDEQFPLKFAKCHLESIEIKKKEFFQTGLGTAMLKTMEAFAIANSCFQIYAHFQPYGDFACGSRRFYNRNGFTIEYDPCDNKQYATKLLPKKEKSSTASPTKNGGGKE